MYMLKALGLDGMPFFILLAFLTKTILDFCNFGIIPSKFNETHIVLVPKIKEPKRVTNYYPISLCNVVYKLA